MNVTLLTKEKEEVKNEWENFALETELKKTSIISEKGPTKVFVGFKNLLSPKMGYQFYGHFLRSSQG